MKLEQNKKIKEKEILKKYYNWINQKSFLELNEGCSGCGACSGGAGCGHNYPCDCNGCGGCSFAIRTLTKILIEDRMN